MVLLVCSAAQGVRRHVFGVVDAADDDRLIGIALEKLDDDFLSDARQEHRPPPLAGPVLRDANPARALLVVLSFAIPVELDAHAAVLVGVDLLAARPDDDGGLRAGDDRLRRAPGGAVGHGVRNAAESIAVRFRGQIVARVGSVGAADRGLMAHLGEHIGGVEIPPIVTFQLEAIAAA